MQQLSVKDSAMRKAKDNENVPKHYYRPIEKTCPYCDTPLRRRYTLWHKYLVTLEGRIHVFSLGYSCRRRCSRALYRSVEAERVSPERASFGVDLITQVAGRRFREHRPHDELATLL